MTETDAAMLAFERQRWARPGAKDAAIRERFGPMTDYVYKGSLAVGLSHAYRVAHLSSL